jgi:putative transposase
VPRAHRHYLPGCIWHITHRCHKKEFLLKFEKDRNRWLYWLFEARKRYNTSVLDYTVTSNHIHLLLLDNGGRDVIPETLQLIAGRTGQEYNQRKNRKGAFWEDRYHATAVEKDDHLIKCLVYIDLNMVRTGVVGHPSEWPWSGYNEIQKPRERYTLVDRARLKDLLNMSDDRDLSDHHRQWVDEALKEDRRQREDSWTESVAVGSKEFVERTRQQLGMRAKGRKIAERDGGFELRETGVSYLFDGKKCGLSLDNAYLWDESHEMSVS